MKYSSVVQLAASVSVAAAASSTTCPPASVYVFEPQHKQQKTVSSNTTPQLSNKQSQFLLADFLGTSSLYSSADIKDEFPSDLVHKYIASLTNAMNGDTSNSNLATAIVVINGLPDSHTLFQESSPEFEIKESPSPSFFRAFLDRMSGDMTKVSAATKSLQQSADKAVSVVSSLAHKIEEAALKGLKDIGIYKRHPMMGDAMGHMMDSMMEQSSEDDDEDCSSFAGQRLKDDLARLETLASKGLAPGEKALLRLESLDVMLQNSKYAQSYEKAVGKISKAINNLADHVDDANLRLMVVAAPRDACTNKQETLLKPCSSKSGLKKRSSTRSTIVAKSFPSIEACETATGNCTGHGACIKTGTALDGETPVYGCACQASYNADKKQTTRYGGAACQKVDISVPTQMFLWSGIALVFAGAAAIKLVYSIDAEPLPGILNLGKKPTTN
ncbi:uncharacterized protein SAPINGB_P004820 [Magnusiomyces paraingens]|uniref:Uncharacterized protein n=1 Tax=Magnusiomyces paraingens TaxID=2606893 RepID=A0A5E8BWU2_9ASCO|nr:uncharacterized protein SAPINGB_P004820 [Saprochaete ingens]VVT56109.1 unnamed protein product [Saprochaete ingens]